MNERDEDMTPEEFVRRSAEGEPVEIRVSPNLRVFVGDLGPFRIARQQTWATGGSLSLRFP